MNALAGVAQLVADLFTLTGAAAYMVILLSLLAVAGRWFLRHRWLPGEYRRLAEWTRALAEYVEATELKAEHRVFATTEAWEGWAQGYDRYWLAFAMATFEDCANASGDEIREWRDHARAIQRRGAGPLLFAYDLALHHAQRRGSEAAQQVRSAFPYNLIDDHHLPAWRGAPDPPGCSIR